MITLILIKTSMLLLAMMLISFHLEGNELITQNNNNDKIPSNHIVHNPFPPQANSLINVDRNAF